MRLQLPRSGIAGVFLLLAIPAIAFAASASPSAVNFGNVPINTTASQSITLTVDSGYRTEIASGSGINLPFSFDFDTCGAGGGFSGPGTCTVKESYHPTAVGAANGTTTVFECPIAGGSCLPIPYTVSGSGVSLAAASPSAVAFGNVPINTTASQSITLTVDAGYRTEIASGSGINLPFSFDFDTCGAGGGFSGPGTCTVKESYHPTAVGAANGTTTVFECPIAGGSCLPIPYTVSGSGVSLAAASPSAVAFGNVPINTTASQSITLTVDAGYRTEIASGSGINLPFSFDFDTCGAGGGFSGPGTCTVKESYHPTAVGAANGTTTVFECPIAGGSCLPIPYTVSGSGVSLAAASPSAVDFGNVPINTTASQSITLTVDAGYRTEIASGSGINLPFSFDFDTCGAGGGFSGPGTCTVKESYHPTAVGAANGTTTVFECPIAGGSCLPIPYTVSGSGVSLAAASPSAVAFGNVPINTTASQSITLTVDAGYRTEIASGSGINLPFSFDFDTCGAGGGFSGPGTCTVKESYHPTAVGAANGTTTVFECPIAGGSCLPIPYTVSGSGVSLAAASPSAVAFGNVPINTTASQSITLTVDAGYRTEIASGSGINLPFSFDFDTCGAGGGFSGPGTCTVKESYHPTAVGAANGTTTVFECPIAGGSCLPIPYTVSGSGVSLAAASPSAVDFGNVPINTTASQSITLTVDAGYRTEIASGSGINLPFSFDFDTCGAGGGFSGPGTCTVKESYHPTAVGAANGTTTVFECPIAGGSCLPIPYTVSGSGVSLAAASPSAVAFGNVPINTTASQSITLTVDAGYRTEIASGSGINLPFSFDFDTCGAGGGFSGPGTCTVKESYHPTAVGAANGTTTVFECPIAGGSCLPIPYTVSGSGVSAPTLLSIAVTPASPTIASGNDQQFTATGTYSDGSTADLTSLVDWASSTPAVATIGATTGIAHGVSPGTSAISATLGTVSGDTLLTVVDATPPTVETPVLSPDPAAVGATVSVTAAATDASGIASAQVSVDGGPWTALGATDGAFGGTSEGLTGTITAPAPAGIHGVCVRATDSVGNTSSGTACATLDVVTKVNQTITFANPGAQTMAQPTLTVSATASSGLDVTFTTSTPSVCTAGGLNGATITLVGPGTCTVRADQPGTAVYNPAPTVSRSFTVKKVNQTITFANPGAQTMAQPTLTVSATASSGLDVTFTTSTPSVCTAGGLNGATITLVGPGTCTVRADQPGTAVYNPAPTVSRNFTVKKVNQTITFANPGAQTMAQPTLTVSATASSGLDVTFTTSTPSVCTAGGLHGATITLVGPGTCTVSADQPGTAVYNPAPTVSRNFTVKKVNQTITFANPGAQTMAQPTLTVSATASSGLA